MSTFVNSPAEHLKRGKVITLAQVADGAEGLVLADLARAIAAGKDAPAISLAVICRDGQRMASLSRALAFFGPDIELERWLEIPDQQMFAWVNGMEPAPAEIETGLFRRLRDFRGKGVA